MTRFLLWRVLHMVIVFVGVTLIIYFAVWTLPGDPIRVLAGNRTVSPSTEAALRARYHLNEPFIQQYFHYVVGLLRGDLGTNFEGRPVSQLMSQAWPVTAKLGITAWLLESVLGLLLGVVAAVRHRRLADHVILVVSIAIISAPVFVLAYTAQLVLGVNLKWFPVAGVSEGWPRSYILPSLILAAFGIATVTRLVRTNVLENLRADYTRTAYAKGLSPLRVIVRHVMRNSLIPAVTVLAIDLGYLLSGAIVIEGVFNLPGIGQLLFISVANQEGTVVVGVASILVVIFLLANLVVDVLYGILDPRVRS